MKYWILLAMTCVVVTAASAQVRSGAYRLMLKGLLKHSVPEITVADAARDSATLLFLDTREPREYAVSHIPGALPVGYERFDLPAVAGLDRQRPIVVYCSVGYRSEKITEKLIAAGFSRVSNLYGGIFEWLNQGHAVVNAEGPTQNVHAYSRTWGVWLKKGKRVY